MMQGQLQAQATMTQAMGLLIGAGLQMGLGVASIAATSVKVGKINARYEERANNVPDATSPEGREQISKIRLEQQNAISNELQSSESLKSLQLLEQIAPNIAQGAGNMASAQYTIQAATAEASKMLFQQAIQAAQAIYQDMGQDIQSSSQDISAFLQAFTQISSSMTQQA